MQIKELRQRAGLTYTDAPAFCGVHRATWHRWEAGRAPPPVSARRLLEIAATGADVLLPGGAFYGWGFNRRDGELYDECNGCYRPGEIRSIPYLHALIAALKAELREIRGKTAIRRERPGLRPAGLKSTA